MDTKPQSLDRPTVRAPRLPFGYLTDTLSAADAFGTSAESGAVYGAQVGAGGVATAILVVLASLAAGTLG